jgi:hypothetical protein
MIILQTFIEIYGHRCLMNFFLQFLRIKVMKPIADKSINDPHGLADPIVLLRIPIVCPIV